MIPYTDTPFFQTLNKKDFQNNPEVLMYGVLNMTKPQGPFRAMNRNI